MSSVEHTSFGELLRRYRGEARLTQQELAKRASVSIRSIRALEHGESQPHGRTAQRLAVALELQAELREQFIRSGYPTPRGFSARLVKERYPDLAAAQPSGHDHEQPARADAPPSAITGSLMRDAQDLPIPPTSLIAREAELAAVALLIGQDDIRLVTLTGPGGVGKTRLALQVALAARPNFADGIVFVALAPLDDPNLVLATIAATLGLQEVGTRPLLGSLTAYLRDKRLLLLLDNFEHVTAAALQIAALQQAVPYLKVLVTSRIPLRLQAEQLFPVQPLALPTNQDLTQLEVTSQVDAVRLFVQRAKRALPSFELSTANLAAVVSITRLLDGLPLAIELAAARIAVMSPQALLKQLQHPLRVLTHGAVDLPERQQTLRDTIAWSYDLLAANEQAIFRRVAVCSGGCTFEAAATIAAEPGSAEGLISLAEKNMLEVVEGAIARFTMLSTIRQFGQEQLTACGETNEVRRRHAAFYLEFAEAAVARLQETDPLTWADQLDAELDNLRAAFVWRLEAGSSDDALTDQALLVAGKLQPYWSLRGRASEALMWLGALLAAPGAERHSVGRARALQTSALLKVATGDRFTAYVQSQESLTICRELGDQHEIAYALLNLGRLGVEMSPPDALLTDDGLAQLELALHLMREAGDYLGTALALRMLGFRLLRHRDFKIAVARFSEVLAMLPAGSIYHGKAEALLGLAEAAWLRGDPIAARSLALQSLELQQATGSQFGRGHLLGLLADIARQTGDYDTAHAYYVESLRALRALGEVPRTVRTLWGMALLAAAMAQTQRALQLTSAAIAISQATLIPPYSSDDARLAPLWALADRECGQAERAATWPHVQPMSLDQAIAFALDEWEAS